MVNVYTIICNKANSVFTQNYVLLHGQMLSAVRGSGFRSNRVRQNLVNSSLLYGHMVLVASV